MSSTVGFIGLGNMGGPMAANLAKAGHEVMGFDMAEVAIEGVTMAGSGAEAATGAEVVITMLPNGAILRSVAQDVLPVMSTGAGLVDCSTVDVDSARAVAAEAAEAGLLFVDAPVSGGIGGAAGGTLTFFGATGRALVTTGARSSTRTASVGGATRFSQPAAPAIATSPTTSQTTLCRRRRHGKNESKTNMMVASWRIAKRLA